ncbi:hypothetical protein GCM10010442_18910 [Kitasatospora kifunensis]
MPQPTLRGIQYVRINPQADARRRVIPEMYPGFTERRGGCAQAVSVAHENGLRTCPTRSGQVNNPAGQYA